MSKFTVVTVAGSRMDADEVTAGVFEADSVEDVVRQIAEEHELDEMLEEITDEGDHWAVWQEEAMHYIVKVD